MPHRQAGISRRGFLTGGIVAFTSMFMPRSEGSETEFYLPVGPQTAEAAEAAKTGDNDGQTPAITIDVVDRHGVGIYVYDISQGAERAAEFPLERMWVTVSVAGGSRGSVSGYTDETGKVILDVRSLSDEYDDIAIPAEYEGCAVFDARVVVQARGYRSVMVAKTHLMTPCAYSIPTRPADDIPYLESLAFDGWDVLFTRDSFPVSTENDIKHRLEGYLYSPMDQMCTLTLLSKKGGLLVELSSKQIMVKTCEDGVPFDFDDFFLLAGHQACVPYWCEGTTWLKFEFESSGQIFMQQIGLSGRPALFAEEETRWKRDQGLSLFRYDQSAFNLFSFPDTDDWPYPIRGTSISLVPPFTPGGLILSVNSHGLVMVGYRCGSVASNMYDGQGWKDASFECSLENFDKYVDNLKSRFNSYNSARANAWSGQRPCKFPGSQVIEKRGAFTFSKYFEGYLRAMVDVEELKKGVMKPEGLDPKDIVWKEGALCFSGNVELGYCYTAQAMLFYIPVYYGFNVSGKFGAGFDFKASTWGGTIAQIFEGLEIAPSVDVQVRFCITAGVSAGIGINGLATVGLRAAFNFSIGYFLYTNEDDVPEGRDRHRVLVGVSFGISLVVQIACFKWSGDLYKPLDKPDWVDTWHLNSASSGDRMLTAVSEGRDYYIHQLADRYAANGARTITPETINDVILDELQIVGADELMRSREFTAAPEALSFQIQNADALSAATGLDPESDASASLVPVEFSRGAFAGASPYTYVGDWAGVGDLMASAGEIGGTPFGGVRVTSDRVIGGTVFSGSRCKVFYDGDGPYVLRIANVDYGGEVRPRVTWSRFANNAWSEPQPVDFPVPEGSDLPGIEKRLDMYDYDFDAVQVGAGQRSLYFLIVSGARGCGDATSLTDATTHVVTLYQMFYSPGSVSPGGRATTWRVGTDKHKFSVIEPRLSVYEKEWPTMSYSAVMGTYMLGRADAPTSSTNYLGHVFAPHGAAAQPVTVTYTRNAPFYGSETAHGVPMAGGFDACADVSSLAGVDASAAEIHYRLPALSTGALNSRLEVSDWAVAWRASGDGGLSYTASYSEVGLYTLDDPVTSLGSLSDGVFIGARNGAAGAGDDDSCRHPQLVEVDFGCTLDETGAPSVSPIGPKEGAPSAFVVSNSGNYLIYYENKENESTRLFNRDGSIEAEETTSYYFLKALARVKGTDGSYLFSKPFVFAELDHPVEELRAATTAANGSAVLVATRIRSLDDSIAELHDIRVPLVTALSSLSLMANDPFAMAGEKAEFTVLVRNDGNIVVTEATFALYLEDGATPVSTCRINFTDAEQAELNAASCSAKDYDTELLAAGLASNPLADAEVASSMLVPGYGGSYKVRFDIPEDWSGKKNVYVKVIGCTPLEVQAADLAAGSDDIRFCALADERCPRVEVEFRAPTGGVSPRHLSAKMVGVDDDGNATPSDPDDTSGSGDAGGSAASGGLGASTMRGGSGGRSVPNTGDSADRKLPAAVAALGAVALAYSRRREENERWE